MQSEDIIEFFNFVPSFLLNELHEKILQIDLDASTKQSLEKNFFIFETFVLKNIFTFPSEFKFERKITDKCVDTKIQDLVTEYTKLVDNNYYLILEKIKLENEIEIKKSKLVNQEIFLKNNEDIIELEQRREEIESERKEMEELYRKFEMQDCNVNDSGIDLIMAEEEVMNEIYKKDKDELYKKVNVHELDEIIKMNEK